MDDIKQKYIKDIEENVRGETATAALDAINKATPEQIALAETMADMLSDCYDHMYNAEVIDTPPADTKYSYDQLMMMGDNILHDNQDLAVLVTIARGFDPVSSDRECAALGYAAEKNMDRINELFHEGMDERVLTKEKLNKAIENMEHMTDADIADFVEQYVDFDEIASRGGDMSYIPLMGEYKGMEIDPVSGALEKNGISMSGGMEFHHVAQKIMAVAARENMALEEKLELIINEVNKMIERFRESGNERAATYLENSLKFSGIHIDNGGIRIEDPRGAGLVSVHEYEFKENCIDALTASKEKANFIQPEKEVSKQQEKEQEKQQEKPKQKDMGLDR